MQTVKNQAVAFAKKHNVELVILGKPEYRKYFNNDKDARYVFKLKLSTPKGSYTFTFGQSIASGSKDPNIYDVLVCLTKYDPESFEDFCGNYGYDTDSRSAEKVYKCVVKEWQAVERIFTNEQIEELQEIN